MQEFKIFRALGLSFKSWFKNFIPFTLLTAILYAPIMIWVSQVNVNEVHDVQELINKTFLWPIYAVLAASTLLAPMLTYRVVMELNGTKVSMLTSAKYGVRGIIPALILAVVVNVLQQIPFGGILASIVTCIWFVAAPAAVAEQLNPISALSRSADLTKGRRWGIFGLNFLIGLVMIALVMAWIIPMFSRGDADSALRSLKSSSYMFLGVMGLFHMFTGIVEAVSYALLRVDKEGITHEQLAKVFE